VMAKIFAFNEVAGLAEYVKYQLSKI